MKDSSPDKAATIAELKQMIASDKGGGVGGGSAESKKELEKARSIALRRLSTRARSTLELRRDLEAAEIPQAAIDEILDRFTKVGLLNDEDFAQQWVTQRRTSKSLSTAKLRYELREKGISGAIIDAVLSDTVDLDAQIGLDFARKKIASMGFLDRTTAIRRLSSQMERRGFSHSIISRSVIQVVNEAGIGSITGDE
ncbi:MAG: recombination regulator RecX [Propionibacteriaceae bacterium]|nr:recombination regulator RecX [Propionibacteriaceae bacterium]